MESMTDGGTTLGLFRAALTDQSSEIIAALESIRAHHLSHHDGYNPLPNIVQLRTDDGHTVTGGCNPSNIATVVHDDGRAVRLVLSCWNRDRLTIAMVNVSPAGSITICVSENPPEESQTPYRTDPNPMIQPAVSATSIHPPSSAPAPTI